MTQVTAVEMEPGVAGWEQLGASIVACVGARDFGRFENYFHPRVASRLLTPSALTTPLDLPTLISKFDDWFNLADHFDLESSQITRVGDCLHIGYRIRLREEGIWYVVEQQTYSLLEGGRIVHFDLVCSGCRPDDATI